MNHNPFKINEAILDMWRDLKAGDDYISRLEVRNAELVSENTRLKAENERLINAGDRIASIIKPPAHGPGEWDGEWDMWKLAKDNKYL